MAPTAQNFFAPLTPCPRHHVQNRDGVDVCLLVMYVQVYSSGCPNTP